MGLQIEVKHKLTCDQCGSEISEYRDGVIQVHKRNDSKSKFIQYSFRYIPMSEIKEISPSETLHGEILHNNWRCLENYNKAQTLYINTGIEQKIEENEPKEIPVALLTEETSNAEPVEAFYPI